MKYDIVFIKEGNGDFLITNGSQWGTNSFPVTELKNVYIFTKEELRDFLAKKISDYLEQGINVLDSI